MCVCLPGGVLVLEVIHNTPPLCYSMHACLSAVCLCLQAWLAFASLCVLSEEHVESLSSGKWNDVPGADAQQTPAGKPKVRRCIFSVPLRNCV